MLRHLRDPRLVATFGIGFGVLFNFLAALHLCELPSGRAALWLFLGAAGCHFRYLSGRQRDRADGGARHCALRPAPLHYHRIGVWVAGALLLLAPQVGLIITGLTICAACGMLCQAVSTGYVTVTAREGRSSAVGLYVTCFYVGGSVGASLPGLLWTVGGLTAAVAMVIAMLAVMAAIVTLAWDRSAA